jgi:hypothetical protein
MGSNAQNDDTPIRMRPPSGWPHFPIGRPEEVWRIFRGKARQPVVTTPPIYAQDAHYSSLCGLAGNRLVSCR